MKIHTKKYNTATGSARMLASTNIGSRKMTASIPYPYELSTEDRHKAAAVNLVKKFGFSGRFDPDGFDGSTHVFYRD